jgi:predicted alpha/beta hydrolase family esterase
MKPNIFIFHGAGGNPNGNWFPWLAGKLRDRGHEVFVPKFPATGTESLTEWLAVLQPLWPRITSDSILIGYSLGGLFLLRVLERLDHPVRGSVFVAATVGVRPINEYWDRIEQFTPGFVYDWPKIRANAGHAAVFHADNDPYPCLGNGQELARQLGVELTMIPGGGHLGATAGYTKFPEVLGVVEILERV